MDNTWDWAILLDHIHTILWPTWINDRPVQWSTGNEWIAVVEHNVYSSDWTDADIEVLKTCLCSCSASLSSLLSMTWQSLGKTWRCAKQRCDFFTRPRSRLLCQDKDFRNFPKPSRFGLIMVPKTVIHKHMSEQSNVVKSTTAACSQKYQLIPKFPSSMQNFAPIGATTRA